MYTQQLIIKKRKFFKMVGRPSKKVQCEATTKRYGRQCRAKGILKKNGHYICRMHGGLSFGPVSIEGKIRALQNLRQYKNKTYEEIREYIQTNN